MRRVLLCVFVGLYAVVLCGQPLADGLPKFLGCAHSSTQAPNFAKYWNQVTPENGGKWGAVEGTRDKMNWSAFDAAYKVAKDNGFVFKNHTMIWGGQQPSWIESLDTAEQRQEIEEWFALTAERYPDLDFIDVVNEPIHQPPSGSGKGNYVNALGGNGATGWDWVIRSFKLARKYFPASKLLINEYSVTNSSASAKAYAGIINLLKADSLIDGIGIQAHAFSTYGISATNIKANLDILAATGLPIYVSELDIDGFTDLAQYKEYKRVFPVFWEHPAVEGITLWGYRYGLWRTDQGAYLVTQAGTERPAFKWLQAYVKGNLVVSEAVNIRTDNERDTIYIDENLQLFADVVPENTTVKNVTWSISPSSVATINGNGLLVPNTPGKVTVAAKTWDKDIKGTKEIVIIRRLVDSISVSLSEDTVTVGESVSVSAVIYPENATNKQITWSSEPAGMIEFTVDDSITALSPGVVKIIVTAADGSGVSDTSILTILPLTGIDNHYGIDIIVFPNPSLDGKIEIANIEANSNIAVYDMKGYKVAQYDTGNSNRVWIKIDNGPGIYMIVIYNNRNIACRKIKVG